MTVRTYSSADVGAPGLRSNSPGDVIALLTAILVNGYGSKAGAGWTREFVNPEGTIAAFKQGLGSNGMFLRVDDTALATASGQRRHARAVGYEQMSSLNSGLPGPFPTEAQIPGGLAWVTLNNNTASWTSRDDAKPWLAWADERLVYITWQTQTSAANASYRELFIFGDSISYNPADAFNTYIFGRDSLTSNSTTALTSQMPAASGATSMSGASLGSFCARANNQETSSLAAGNHVDRAKNAGASNWGGNGGDMPAPNPADGAIYMSPIWLHDPSSSAAVLRGHLPGLWSCCHPMSEAIVTGDTFNGQGQMEGRRFQVIRQGGTGVSTLLTLFVEISDTWRDD